MFLTNFARIGKSFIRCITGVQENYKKIEKTETKDLSICLDCPLFKSTSNAHITYCQNYCNKPRIIKEKVIYYNEANRFHIPIRERLSKLQLKQILLYHFLNIDNNGIVKNISTKEIAKFLNCSIKTVKNNNERLVKLNYILYSKISNDKFSIWLTDYKNYHLTQKEGGSGYITMSKELLINLININTVNSLRLELRKLIEFDDQNIQTDEVNSGKYTYQDIKRFLPKYLHYKGAIEDIINSGSNSFQTTIENNCITFKLKNEYNSELLRKDIINECEPLLNDYFNKFNFIENEVIDILQMSIQYGTEKIKNSLNEIYNNYILKNKHIYNLGGLIRKTIISKNVS